MPPHARVFVRWIVGCVCLLPSLAQAAVPSEYPYVSPMPGSRLVSPHNNVVIRSTFGLDGAKLHPIALTVTGLVSGAHAGVLRLSDDQRTLVFLPSTPFALGERVDVQMTRGPWTTAGTRLSGLSFSFTVSQADLSAQAASATERWDDGAGAELQSNAAIGRGGESGLAQSQPGSIPATYPNIQLLRSDSPEAGHVFITPTGSPGYGNLVIVDNLGMPLFYRKVPGRPADFRMLPNGRLVYFTTSPISQYYMLDSLYAVVDSFKTGNGYVTDLHDFLLLPGGHSLLMAYDPQPVRMDSVVPGGNPNAIVTGLIVQELDAAKDVVFQWRSWDHFEITDAVGCVVNLQAATVDYSHGNAFEVDPDGHIMISSRHMNEITKIHRTTGAVIWRMGLNAKKNQFAFIGDPRGFSHQHDIRRLPNGHITLFDNGNCLSPEYSRALEYALDETNRVATLVWQYRDTPDVYGRATGNVQRRPSGGTMINWGFASKVTDLRPDNTKSYELLFGAPGSISYRGLRFPWDTAALRATPDSLDFGLVAIGDSTQRTVTLRNTSPQSLTIRELFVSNGPFHPRRNLPVTLAPNATVAIPVTFRPNHPETTPAALYAIVANDTQLVAERVKLVGRGHGAADAPVMDAGRFELANVAPSPARGSAEIEYTLPRTAAIHLSVHDLQGRVVGVLADGACSAGTHRVTWNPDPARAAPGLYFIRYATPEGTSNRALILLR